MTRLGIVIKTVERCNLNCSYCYFFNGLDNSYKSKPIFLSRENIIDITKFLRKGIEDLNITSLLIGLHGGEPLMQSQQDFIYLVQHLIDNIPIKIDFALQTNATLITKSWIKIFNEFNISIGVSIDGPAEYHNKYRIDHYGNDSHEAVEKGAKLLIKELNHLPSCLTVINPEFDGKIIYNYLTSLGFYKIDFLFPDYSHDNLPPNPVLSYSKYLKDVSDEWLLTGNKQIHIRILQSIFNQLLGGHSLIYGFGNNSKNLPFITIRSDGAITPTDELMSSDPLTVTNINKNVRDNTLEDVLNHHIFYELEQASIIKPTKCNACCWFKACGSGGLVNRFSKINRFNNPSVFCEALEDIILHQTNYLINSGLSAKTIENNLK